MVNIGDPKRKLLKGLGLEKLFVFTQTKKTEKNWDDLNEKGKETKNSDKLKLSKTMLDAHQALVEIDSKNADKFKDVIEYLL